ncbi:MAG: diguanylate cyclase [Magnetospirillum sp. WYHS-4]
MADDSILSVLLVEDSPTQALQATSAIEAAGGIVDHADTLAAAEMRLRAGRFDVVLLDLNLPDSQGSATVERICRSTVGTPVIVLTAEDDDRNVDAALDLGAQDFLVKGQLHPEALGRAFRYAIHRKRAEGELVRTQEELRLRLAQLEDSHERLEAQGAHLVALADDLAIARDMALQANHGLEKRIRETDCLYSVSRTLDDPNLPLGSAMQRVVNLVADGWEHSEVAAVRLSCPEACRAGSVATANFQDSPWKLWVEILVGSVPAGYLEVVYVEERPDLGGGPFLPSERRLIEELARRLGQALERVRMQDELRRLATTDPLTGASNRRHFLDVAEREMVRSRRYGHPISVMMLDLDHFKKVNDSHGHALGDEVLKAFVVCGRQTLREQDLLGRMGGEEFSVVLPETDMGEAILVAERMRKAVARLEFPLPDGRVLKVTCSIGVAECLRPDESLEGSLHRADTALYRAKEGGRDRVETPEEDR